MQSWGIWYSVSASHERQNFSFLERVNGQVCEHLNAWQDLWPRELFDFLILLLVILFSLAPLTGHLDCNCSDWLGCCWIFWILPPGGTICMQLFAPFLFWFLEETAVFLWPQVIAVGISPLQDRKFPVIAIHCWSHKLLPCLYSHLLAVLLILLVPTA